MEDNRIQNQIAIYMTNKKLCEFTDKLKPAPIEYYAHMHAQGEEQADGIRAYHRPALGRLRRRRAALRPASARRGRPYCPCPYLLCRSGRRSPSGSRRRKAYSG